jgi:hypothetical protein
MGTGIAVLLPRISEILSLRAGYRLTSVVDCKAPTTHLAGMTPDRVAVSVD